MVKIPLSRISVAFLILYDPPSCYWDNSVFYILRKSFPWFTRHLLSTIQLSLFWGTWTTVCNDSGIRSTFWGIHYIMTFQHKLKHNLCVLPFMFPRFTSFILSHGEFLVGVLRHCYMCYLSYWELLLLFISNYTWTFPCASFAFSINILMAFLVLKRSVSRAAGPLS